MQVIIDERPGAILPMRTEQIEEAGATTGDLGAMGTKLNLWTLNGYDQIAYYDADHVFLSNADSIFDECGCDLPFCGVWDPRIPTHTFLHTFGQPSSGQYARRLVNAGMLVLRPDRAYAVFLRTQWARRSEFMMDDLDMVAKGSDQTFFNHMMGDRFRTVDQGFNLMHIERTALATPDKLQYKRYLNLNGTAMDPSTPTVPHLKAWTRGRAYLEKAVHAALRERFVEHEPYIRELLLDPRCAADVVRPVATVPGHVPRMTPI